LKSKVKFENKQFATLNKQELSIGTIFLNYLVIENRYLLHFVQIH